MINASGIGPSVWTGRALQVESDDLEVVGLALLYPALERAVLKFDLRTSCNPGYGNSLHTERAKFCP